MERLGRLRSQRITGTAIVVIAAIVVGGFNLAPHGTARENKNDHAVGLLSSGANIGSTYFNANVGANSDGYGWAVTNVGLQLSNDGGSQWSVVSSPIPAALVESVVVRGSAVWVAGIENGIPVVDVSMDNGVSWLAESLPNVAEQVGSVSLVGEGNSLVGLAYDVTTSSNFSVGGWIGYSNVNGLWTNDSSPFGGTVTDVNGALWLVGGPTNSQLAVSSDQGNSWKVVAVPASISGSALTVAGGFNDGSVALVASAPSETNSDGYLITVLNSSNNGLSWNTTYTSDETGSIGIGVASPSVVAGNLVWIGGNGTPSLTTVSETGQSSSSTLGSSNSSVQNLLNVGSSKPWVETVSSSCPTTKSSCADSSQLMVLGPTASGWQPAPLSNSITTPL